MDLFSLIGRVFKKGEKGFGESWTPIYTGAQTTEQNLLAANKEWVFIAADRVAASAAGVRIKAMKFKRNGEDQEVFDGPLVDFLEQPAPNFTGKDFVYLNTIYKEITGNAFWQRDSKKLLPMIPTQVSPVFEGGKLVKYRYSNGAAQVELAVKDVLHDRYVDPAKPYWGVGKLVKIARWVDTSSFANEFLRRFFINGATFGGFITTEETSQERIALIKAGLANDHVGVENAHKIGILPQGSDFKQTTSKMSDMEMGATDDRYRDKILAAFGVPKSILGLTTDVNRANAEAMEYVFAKYTLTPIVEDLIEFLNANVAPVLDPSGATYFAYDPFIPENREIKIRENEVALNRQPYKTVNEVRADAGLPPVKGGDVIYGNPFQVPLGTPQPEPTPNPDQDEDEEEEGEPKKAAPRSIRGALKKDRLIEGIAKKLQKAVSTKDVDLDAATHKRFVARVDAHEKLIADKVKDFNNRQHRDVLLNLNSITKAVSKTDIFDEEQEVAVLVDMVSPLLRNLMLEQAIEEYKAQGYDGALDPNAKAISKAVELASKRLARSYNDTTATLLKSALNEGLQEGDDYAKLAERVQQVYEFSSQVRALMVAKTESVYIANEGSKEAYRQSGVVSTMRWYTAEDELTCEFCAPQNGKVIGVNETFYGKGETVVGADGGTLTTDYRAIDVPPLHPNCRCLIRPEDIEVN